MTIEQEIQDNYLNFSEKEKQIATFLLNHADTIANINISRLAELTGTSGATITRFARKLNCESFVELKIKLNVRRDTLLSKSSDTIKDTVYNYYYTVIKKTEGMTDLDQLQDVVKKIKSAKRIFVFGVGSSGLSGAEFSQRLLRMGLNTISSADSHMMVINSSITGPGDLVFGISASGETKEVNNAMKLAKENKATIVGMTCFPKSALGNISDILIQGYSSLFVGNDNFINTQFSIMYQIDLLSTILLEDKTLSKKMSRTISAITKQ
ncbi:MurR/RpiR family transcriptional regulator [Enterococcus italicus]|uniref:SIS domain protein n=1 Tax=Enterococcus italicus (strain DSM 15952 / CCUG 50447 / LMG 22039 / TP 1.5) TaxID=888064 RepID=E6LG85_ENTI1|nr:MurR/RpiR family transcriptional regulator [Enterococcus italicus]EFU73772.1 SIS domain protein [Enterococcus italicus DSM 15952]OJG56675.1 RpiR family transcriptional regulator [Enterococcus italicus DSM 15952]